MGAKMCPKPAFATTFHPFSALQREGAIVVAVFAALSTLACVALALRVFQDAIVLYLRYDNRASRRPSRILFFRTQLGHYAACLILSNLFISTSELINFAWLSHSGLIRGPACLAQAALMQIGIWGTCWFTVAHGVHSLLSIVFRVRQARWPSVATISIGWAIALPAGLVPLTKNGIYGPNGISCGIMYSYPKELFFLGALPIFLGAFVSTTVYSVTFLVMHWRQAANKSNLRGLSLINRRGEGRSDEYCRFVSMILWTMICFPLAFVVLLSPCCVIYILMYAGHSIPPVPSVLGDVCASMLGFVNVCLLCNTFRAIDPVYRAANVSETVATFGHDASHEPAKTDLSHVQFVTSSLGSIQRTSHSYNSSVDSTTGLIGGEKTSYESVKTKVAPLMVHFSPPAGLDRQIKALALPHSYANNQHIIYSGATKSLLRVANPSPCPRRDVCTTGYESSTQNEKGSLKLLAESDVFVRDAEKYSEAPLDHLSLSGVVPYPTSPVGAMNKSSVLATRLGIPVSPGVFYSRCSRANPPGPGSPKIEIPAPQSPRNVDDRHLSAASSVSYGSHFSGEIMHAYKVRTSQVPQLDDDEQDIVGPFPPARTRRITTVTMWSQESIMTEEEAQDFYLQMIDELLEPGAKLGHGTNALVGRMSRQMTRARPITLRIQPRGFRLSDTNDPDHDDIV